jgi:hypothetical protein
MSEEKGGPKPPPEPSTLDDWARIIERNREEALDDPTPTSPALVALERARAAWARVHDQLSLDV